MAKLVSARYAEALFGCAAEGNMDENMERFSNEARFILKMLDEDEELQKFIIHPHITEDEKIEALEAILRESVGREIMGLVVTVFRKRREDIFKDIFEDFLKLADEHNNVAKAYVTSAVPIDEVRLETIRSILCEKFGKNVVLEPEVDKTQVGGLKILVQGYSFDRTIKSYINELQTKL